MKFGKKELELGKRTYVMGILNFTPDSFSDGGNFNNIDLAVKRARQMILDGADIIDIGGESTRPGASFVSEEEEIKRVVPIIKAIKNEMDILISIDTYKSATAEEAIKAGADIINDVWGFKKDYKMAKVAKKYNVPCILMHNRFNTNYENFLEDVLYDLKESINIALEAGVEKEKIILDPGIGFVKNYDQNLLLLNNLKKVKSLGYPVLLGTSRKSFIGLTLDVKVEERVEGTLATSVIGVMNGCEFVRVHDVLENKRAVVMTDKILKAR